MFGKQLARAHVPLVLYGFQMSEALQCNTTQHKAIYAVGMHIAQIGRVFHYHSAPGLTGNNFLSSPKQDNLVKKNCKVMYVWCIDLTARAHAHTHTHTHSAYVHTHRDRHTDMHTYTYVHATHKHSYQMTQYRSRGCHPASDTLAMIG